jgi:hypothetical protein
MCKTVRTQKRLYSVTVNYLKHLYQNCQHTTVAHWGFIFTPRFPPLAACNWFTPGDKETEENIIIIKVLITYINIEFVPSYTEVSQMFHGTSHR